MTGLPTVTPKSCPPGRYAIGVDDGEVKVAEGYCWMPADPQRLLTFAADIRQGLYRDDHELMEATAAGEVYRLACDEIRHRGLG